MTGEKAAPNLTIRSATRKTAARSFPDQTLAAASLSISADNSDQIPSATSSGRRSSSYMQWPPLSAPSARDLPSHDVDELQKPARGHRPRFFVVPAKLAADSRHWAYRIRIVSMTGREVRLRNRRSSSSGVGPGLVVSPRPAQASATRQSFDSGKCRRSRRPGEPAACISR